jgi:hypothetical protein
MNKEKYSNRKIVAKFILLFFISFLIFIAGSCGGDGKYKSNSGSSKHSVNLAWESPTTNDDGTLLTDLAGYKIYHGTSPGDYTTVIDVGMITQYTVKGLEPGFNYFVVTAYNITRNESAYSNEVNKEIK